MEMQCKILWFVSQEKPIMHACSLILVWIFLIKNSNDFFAFLRKTGIDSRVEEGNITWSIAFKKAKSS